MEETRVRTYAIIRKLFENDLKLLENKVPTNGIWTVCALPGIGYQGAVRIVPSDFGSEEYTLWIDVFQTIYDPIYSNALAKGSIEDMKTWLREESHVEETYECMHHLYLLSEDE